MTHDLLADRTEDAYAVLSGDGWLEVNRERIAIEPQDFMSVSVGLTRRFLAGANGLTIIAVCSTTIRRLDRDGGSDEAGGGLPAPAPALAPRSS